MGALMRPHPGHKFHINSLSKNFWKKFSVAKEYFEQKSESLAWHSCL